MAEIYSASDYAGLNGGKYSFYYGYEFGKELDDDGREREVWGFEARVNGVVVLRARHKESWPSQWDTEKCLMYGIANFFDKETP